MMLSVTILKKAMGLFYTCIGRTTRMESYWDICVKIYICVCILGYMCLKRKKKKERFDFDLITYEDTNSKQWCNI